MFKLKCLNVVN
ncbi:hypothetical protein F383_15338 [Gossypium arboreum]|uniref:Uncharacterized protein n=1 Tax=Gossypium arboreum TaxID=29729 RepID=A0A0B0PXB5_GOSAR|nr:hypothetical protein F383_12031 [Gossypium arboreum]KHG28527.1 hypothetical protein F383_12315 [Gossypium arboreum]KHG29094.1 hypothetical protein F383_15338 [Gossypium arboreum]